MIIYSIPLIFLSCLTFLESRNNKISIVKNKYLYFLTFLFLTFFVGFRNEIGCDWDGYFENFSSINSKSWNTLFAQNNISELGNQVYDIGYTLIIKILSYKFNFQIIIFVLSFFFTLPLFIFCSQLKRRYLALTIAYPYFFIVVGMGPIRQSIAITFLMICIICLSNKNFNKFLLFNIFSSLFHFSAIIFSTLLLIFIDTFEKKRLNIFIALILGSILLILTFYNYESVFYKISDYIKPDFYENGIKNNIYNEAKSAIIIWIINFLPITLYLTNISKFKFNKFLKRIVFFFFIYEIFSFLLIFFNSMFAYRFLLYGFPISIYIASFLPDVDILKMKSTNITFSIVILCFASLAFWLHNANHAYCWLPYKNIIMNF